MAIGKKCATERKLSELKIFSYGSRFHQGAAIENHFVNRHF